MKPLITIRGKLAPVKPTIQLDDIALHHVPLLVDSVLCLRVSRGTFAADNMSLSGDPVSRETDVRSISAETE